jgi:flagellar protein FliO/FliZ
VRQTSTIENGWPLQPATEPASTSRPLRASVTEEPWLAPEPGARPRPADSLTGLAAELSTRLNPPDAPAPAPRPEVPARAPVSSHEPAAQADHNLAEMAHQLEAALRRAPVPEGRPPVTDPLAAPGKGADVTARPPQRELRARAEPKFDSKPEPKFDFKPETRTEPPATPGKNLYENLEEEMASLLGRPPGKS